MHAYDLFCSFALFFFFGGGGVWGGQWVGAITFTKDGIFTSCTVTNEMNILWYNLYKSSLD